MSIVYLLDVARMVWVNETQIWDICTLTMLYPHINQLTFDKDMILIRYKYPQFVYTLTRHKSFLLLAHFEFEFVTMLSCALNVFLR